MCSFYKLINFLDWPCKLGQDESRKVSLHKSIPNLMPIKCKAHQTRTLHL